MKKLRALSRSSQMVGVSHLSHRGAGGQWFRPSAKLGIEYEVIGQPTPDLGQETTVREGRKQTHRKPGTPA